MKTKSKALLLSLCAVLLVAASIFGTIAYLTDDEAVINTFTVGKVALGDGAQAGLDEALVNEYGQPIKSETDQTVVELENAPRVQGNDYKLVPGHLYTKDPTVYVKNDSEDSYIFVKVENGIAGIEAATGDEYKTITDQITANDWTQLNTANPNVYWKKWTKGTDTAGTTDLVVFSEFKIDGDSVDAAKLKNYQDATIVVTAYAIQAAGFDSAIEAWNAGSFK